MSYPAACCKSSCPASDDAKSEDGVGLSASSVFEKTMRSSKISGPEDKDETRARPNVLETGTGRVSAYSG